LQTNSTDAAFRPPPAPPTGNPCKSLGSYGDFRDRDNALLPATDVIDRSSAPRFVKPVSAYSPRNGAVNRNGTLAKVIRARDLEIERRAATVRRSA
jgi:hypothetical protein